MTIGTPFVKGQEKTPGSGRKPGARNRLSHSFLEAFAADFEKHGEEVIKIVRMERPHEYLKTAAYLMPREFTGEAAVTVRTIITGVMRHDEIEHYPNRAPQIPPAVPLPVLPVKEGDDANED